VAPLILSSVWPPQSSTRVNWHACPSVTAKVPAEEDPGAEQDTRVLDANLTAA